MRDRWIRRLGALIACALLCPALTGAAESTPEQVVAAFYTAYFHGGKSGLPGADEMRALAPYLSRDLARLIEDARRRQAEAIARDPQDKPPFIEGDLFSSLFEGPTAFTVGAAVAEGDRMRVAVHFTYTDPNGQGAALDWDDAVLLSRDPRGWVIDDVYYLANWAFKPGVDLRGVLAGGDD